MSSGKRAEIQSWPFWSHTIPCHRNGRQRNEPGAVMKRDLFALRALAFATAVVTVVSLSAGSAVADNWDIDPCETDLTVGSVADGMCTIVVADASHTEGELFVTPAGVTRLWLTIKTGDGEGTDNGTVQVAGGKGVTMMVTIPMAAGEELGLTVGNPSTEVSCPDGDPAAAAGGMALYVSDGSRTTNGYRGWIPGGGGAGCSDSAVAGGKGGDAPVWDGDPNNAIVMGGAGEAGQGASPGGGGQTGNYTGGAHGAPAGNDGDIVEGGEPLAGAVPGGGGSDGCWVRAQAAQLSLGREVAEEAPAPCKSRLTPSCLPARGACPQVPRK